MFHEVGNKQNNCGGAPIAHNYFYSQNCIIQNLHKLNITVTIVFGILDLLVTCTYTQQFVYDDDAIIAIQNNLGLVIFNKI